MSGHSSIVSWLENVEFESTQSGEHCQASLPASAMRSRKGMRDLHKNQLDRLSPRTSRRPRKILADTSGNKMSRPLRSSGQLAQNAQDPVSKASQHETNTVAHPMTPRKPATRRNRQKKATVHDGFEGPAGHEKIIYRGVQEDDDAGFEEPTPRASDRPPVLFDDLPNMPPPRLLPSLSSKPSKSQSGMESSTRSRSPVKGMADLLMADRPTKLCDLDGSEAERLGGVLNKYQRLVEISRGKNVIPFHLQADIEGVLHSNDWPSTYHYTIPQEALIEDGKDYKAQEVYQGSWTGLLQSISKQAKKCVREFHSEANWNSRVHEKILALVVENPKYNGAVDYINITDARIQPATLSPSHLSGTSIQSKLVDLAICLKPTDFMEQRILRTLTNLDKASQSINQTTTPALRLFPIGLNLETKIPFTGGDTADVQLAVWAGAGLVKLAQLLDHHGKTGEEIPTLPVLTFHGHDLFLSAIKGEGHGNNLYGQLSIGSTRTLVGAFQMLAALDLLVDWVDKDYRAWFASILE